MKMQKPTNEVGWRIGARSVLRAFLDADLLPGLGAFDAAARGEALVAKHPQGLDFRPLAVARAVFQYLHIARAGHAVFADLFLFFGNRPPEHQQLANVLNGRGVKFLGQRAEHVFAAWSVVRLDPYLDQAMGGQGSVDFLFYVVCEAVGANHHDGIEVVRFSAVVFALGRGKLYLSHAQLSVVSGRRQ